jgi:hypothetical protein
MLRVGDRGGKTEQDGVAGSLCDTSEANSSAEHSLTTVLTPDRTSRTKLESVGCGGI